MTHSANILYVARSRTPVPVAELHFHPRQFKTVKEQCAALVSKGYVIIGTSHDGFIWDLNDRPLPGESLVEGDLCLAGPMASLLMPRERPKMYNDFRIPSLVNSLRGNTGEGEKQMKNKTQRTGFSDPGSHSHAPRIILAALALVFSIAGAVLAFKVGAPQLGMYLTMFAPVFGAVTVNYENPVSVAGGTVAPTAAQSLLTTRVGANIVATADADTTAVVTHNWGLAAGPGPIGGTLAGGAPITVLEWLLQAPAALSLWAVTTKGTNSVTLTKATTASSGNAGAQLRVHCLHHSYLDC